MITFTICYIDSPEEFDMEFDTLKEAVEFIQKNLDADLVSYYRLDCDQCGAEIEIENGEKECQVC